MTTAIIDGDYLTYSAGFASDAQAKKDGKIHEPLSYCLQGINKTIQKVVRNAGADAYIIYLTGKNNFREDVATVLPYKGNRDSKHKPHWYDQIREYLVDHHSAMVVDGMEADDMMGIHQCSTEHTVICGVDKDMYMIPGNHYNWKKDEHKVVSEDEAIRFFYTQLLTGDRTDNIMGCGNRDTGKRKGVGPKKAEQIIAACKTEEEMFKAVGLQYAIHTSGGFPEMVENARLLWILRAENDSIGLRWSKMGLFPIGEETWYEENS